MSGFQQSRYEILNRGVKLTAMARVRKIERERDERTSASTFDDA